LEAKVLQTKSRPHHFICGDGLAIDRGKKKPGQSVVGCFCK